MNVQKLNILTGRVPGMAASNNDTFAFTGAPNSVPAPEKSLDVDAI
jgi:hypothetical protein